MPELLSFHSPTKIIIGDGILEKSLADALREITCKKVLIVTGKASMQKLGVLDTTAGAAGSAGTGVSVFNEVQPNPTLETVRNAIVKFRNSGIDCVIGLGGGSAIDSAKAIAVGLTHEGDVWDYIIGKKAAASATLPVIAVTSTSGTGSHVTPYSVITNSKTQEKPGMHSPYIFPKVAIADTQILKHMPTQLTFQTGIDVLAHAIESYTSKKSSPLTDIYASEAIRLTEKFLPQAYVDGYNIETRFNMAVADTYAGIAIANAGITLAHALAHAISGHFPQIAHGDALAAIYPPVLKFNSRSEQTKHNNIAKLLGGKTDPSKAFEEFAAKMSGIKPLSEMGMIKSSLETIADDAFRYMKGGVDANPARVTIQEAKQTLEKAY